MKLKELESNRLNQRNYLIDSLSQKIMIYDLRLNVQKQLWGGLKTKNHDLIFDKCSIMPTLAFTQFSMNMSIAYGAVNHK